MSWRRRRLWPRCSHPSTYTNIYAPKIASELMSTIARWVSVSETRKLKSSATSCSILKKEITFEARTQPFNQIRAARVGRVWIRGLEKQNSGRIGLSRSRMKRLRCMQPRVTFSKSAKLLQVHNLIKINWNSGITTTTAKRKQVRSNSGKLHRPYSARASKGNQQPQMFKIVTPISIFTMSPSKAWWLTKLGIRKELNNPGKLT